MTHKCPNCGARLKLALFLLQEKSPAGTFQSIAPALPDGLLRSFIWRVLQNRPLRKPLEAMIVVRSEVKTSPHQILIRELKIPATEAELTKLADAYIRLGLPWSRENTMKYTGLGQYRHNRIKDAFVHLLFLEATRLKSDGKIPQQYRLTHAGFRFLGHYCK